MTKIKIKMQKSKLRSKFLIIGSGAGGALSACYLAERGDDVLVLEEGPRFDAADAHANMAGTLADIWREGGAIPIQSNRRLVVAEGRVLGGSTMLNAGLFHRLPEDVAAAWARDHRIAAFSYDALTSCQKKIETALGVAPDPDANHPADRLLKDAAARIGLTGTDVPVAGTTDATGRRRKSNMRRTYLARAEAAGARIRTDSRARRIQFSGSRAASVETDDGTVVACEQLIVSAGALQTPLLLRRSGIAKNIGNTLAVHPTIRVAVRTREPSDAYRHAMSSYQIKGAAPGVTIGASVTTPGTLASVLTMHGFRQPELRDQMSRFALYYVSVKGAPRGHIRNLPGRGNYLVSYPIAPDELTALQKGYDAFVRGLTEAGATAVYPSLRALISIHMMASCPLGEDARAATDSFGLLRGADNVFIHDASILPESPGVNPQGPLMAVVLRCLKHNFPVQ